MKRGRSRRSRVRECQRAQQRETKKRALVQACRPGPPSEAHDGGDARVARDAGGGARAGPRRHRERRGDRGDPRGAAGRARDAGEPPGVPAARRERSRRRQAGRGRGPRARSQAGGAGHRERAHSEVRRRGRIGSVTARTARERFPPNASPPCGTRPDARFEIFCPFPPTGARARTRERRLGPLPGAPRPARRPIPSEPRDAPDRPSRPVSSSPPPTPEARPVADTFRQRLGRESLFPETKIAQRRVRLERARLRRAAGRRGGARRASRAVPEARGGDVPARAPEQG